MELPTIDFQIFVGVLKEELLVYFSLRIVVGIGTLAKLFTPIFIRVEE